MRSVMLLCLIVASAVAGPPALAGVSEEFLSPQCQTPKCPATKIKGDSPITLPYPLDCLQYIVCEESGPRTVACPDDMIFNKNTGMCDTRQNANCVPCWQG
ncbi:peritrophin-1 [Monomorium pharaonis]|uniref:peritrophin-1 n=1 Tax=Monomorium pharaonis TaxID=307658 RepID=UPI00102E102E|nr:peritrophin-1 [Monomorium pharaonis]